MDDRLTRESHGDYGSRPPLDYAGSGGTSIGVIFVILFLGAVVLGTTFIGAKPVSQSGGGAALPAPVQAN